MKYNWQQKDWTYFKYELKELEDKLLRFIENLGYSRGIMDTFSDEKKTETIVDLMVWEAVKTSEIEGEFLSRKDVMSSIKNNLGLNESIEPVKDKRAKGVADLMVSVRNTYSEKLSEEILHFWHQMLMEGSKGIKIGAWRTHEEPMQVVSGALGKEKIHFEAPPAESVPLEMKRFIDWFNHSILESPKNVQMTPVLAAIAHLYFESIHPYEDGNGRIGRAISEKVLSQGVGSPILLSLSKTIESNKKAYYKALMKGQASNKITEWLHYFVQVVLDAQVQSILLINFTLQKIKFFDHYTEQLNERQQKVLQKMFNAGPEGFEGGMNVRKYISIAKTSKATATRDLQNLVVLEALLLKGGGRSTKYVLNLK